MKIQAVKTFGPLTVLVEKQGVNINATNRKLRLEHGDIQITILPASPLHNPFVGKGSVSLAQKTACAHRCEFKAGSSLGGCYVQHLKHKATKAQRYQDLWLTIEPSNFVRATVWGDIGRLNLEGQEHILTILRATEKRTAYISDFAECLPEFKYYAMASCQTSNHVALAKMLGWSIYAGTKEARDALAGYPEPKYNCPVKGDGKDRFGCRRCRIGCNGHRDVIAYTVHHAR